jgi:hypothetical protein
MASRGRMDDAMALIKRLDGEGIKADSALVKSVMQVQLRRGHIDAFFEFFVQVEPFLAVRDSVFRTAVPVRAASRLRCLPLRP